MQKEKGSNLDVKGELFGIQNLLKFSIERIRTLDFVNAQRQAESNYRIEQYDPEDLGEASQELSQAACPFGGRLHSTSRLEKSSAN